MKRLLITVAVAVLCSACQTVPTAAQQAEKQAAAAAEQAKSEIAKAAAANYAADSTLIPFEKMNGKLTPVGEAQLDLLLPDLKTAKSIIIRGHCYRNDIGNAKAAAQARAAAVRQYLLMADIPSSKITVRFDTERPLHGVRLLVSN
ncbi:OmpA family protein [Chromobacterium sphagni]|uniref:OmpA family protein n=1 Tax=Chromobacterium sphagni TaxID=1903179 RepID=UPI0009F34250|nr:OmpA family protein [Chromobacterium sphagni]